MSNDIQNEFTHSTQDGIIVMKGRMPKSAFAQQDLLMLLMSWYQSRDITTWDKIRNIIIANSTITDNIGVTLKPEEVPLDVLNELTQQYLEMALSFFTSHLA